MTANENAEYKIPKPQPAEEKTTPERFPDHYLTQVWVDSFFQPSLSMQQRPSPEVQAKVDAFIDDIIRDVKESFKIEDFMDTDHIIHKDLPKLDLDRQHFYIDDAVPEWPESVETMSSSGIKAIFFADDSEFKKDDYEYTYVFGDMHMQIPRETMYVDLSLGQEETIQVILDKRATERDVDEDSMDND